MPDDRDHYAIYYADKLWNLLPGVYRAQDSDVFGVNGPLREMVNRIGGQAAIVRRSIDRLWEDQSIETCDDWVISYIGDLLATKLVGSLDARGKRLDVAKTIYYRRRRGTVAILEEIASDITGWDARVVEFFRRLSRTRHSLDPEIELPSATDDPDGNRALQLAEGLIGFWTNTQIGGWADLRNAYGAFQAQSPFSTGAPLRPPSAFDEYFHTADFRKGRGRSGWYNIPKLGVFLWRLKSFGVDFTTPVPADPNNPICYTFDPTGREAPLFAASSRAFGDAWVSPQEWQLPTPMSTPLLESELANLYASIGPDGATLLLNSLGVFTKPATSFDLADPSQLKFYPETGRFGVLHPPLNGPVFVTYHYGFSSTIGAGAYDRRLAGKSANRAPLPVSTASGGGGDLAAKLGAMAAVGTTTVADSLTYTSTSDLTGISQATVQAANNARPLIRFPTPSPNSAEWKLDGASASSSLVLEGLFASGGDIVLTGNFDSVTLTCCTFDPGTTASGGFAKSIDGRDLIPCHLWVEAEIKQLTVDRCILGPIQTRANGAIEALTMSDSIVQGLGGDEAINLIEGLARLDRCTILGPAHLHRLYASECILDDVVTVENYQDGCVRFSAWSTGSILPRKYQSVEIAPKSPLFNSRDFGSPDYSQLLQSADNAIVSGAPGATMSAGAENGSEMGAFAREQNPIKERSLLIKYQEFMPLGLVPVVIYVT